MPESEDSQENLSYIRTHVDNLERMVRFQIASNPNSRSAVSDTLKARAGAADVYLALANGPLNQEQLASIVGLDRSNISRIATHLFDAGIINKVPGPKGSRAYSWSDLEQTVGVSKLAKKIVGDSKAKAPQQTGKRASSVPSSRSVEPEQPDSE
ncbi:MAG: MarR family transcriptional regulator [Planctomycetota bacterium]